MRGLGNRLDILERQVEAIKPPREVKCFYVDGNDPDTDVADFLRQQGHDLGEFAIITTFVSPGDGSPAIEPYTDITHEFTKRWLRPFEEGVSRPD